MSTTGTMDEFIGPLLAGNRVACREIVSKKLETIAEPALLYEDLLWPVMEHVEKLYRSDKINTATEHMAIRITRCLADQVQLRLNRAESNQKRILIACADGEPEELGAQMCADLFESRGWDVYFLGGGVPNDEILNLLGQLRPDILLIFGTKPAGVPGVRRLIDQIREIGVNPTMNIMVSGGVFNRADGLWKEVSADLVARNAHQAIPLAEEALPRTPPPVKPGGPKKRRRRRRAVEAAVAEES